jgi:hypothetical protein
MPLDPMYVSVKEAAKFLGDISTWQVYALLDGKKIESRYQGRRRLVVAKSLQAYAEALPTDSPADVA